MELAAKIFVLSLIFVMAFIGFYCVYDIGRIREKWKKDGVDEHQIRADFYRSINNDDE